MKILTVDGEQANRKYLRKKGRGRLKILTKDEKRVGRKYLLKRGMDK